MEVFGSFSRREKKINGMMTDPLKASDPFLHKWRERDNERVVLKRNLKGLFCPHDNNKLHHFQLFYYFYSGLF